jgi:predicted ATP-grasp superfamily ATP-dependent carboligase
VGSGDGVQDRYLDWLAHRAPSNSVVFPCNDDGLQLVGERRAAIVELGLMTIEASDEVLLAMLDKERTYELAAGLGIGVPRRLQVSGWEQVEVAAREIGFPVALKPLQSHMFARNFGMRTKLLTANDERELELAFARIAPLGLDLMVTEVVPGSDERCWTYTAYLDENGEPRFEFTRRKVRQFPPHFGRGCYYLLEWREDVATTGLRFLQGVGARGLASVEFKRDPRDGQLKVLDCNHRFDRAIGLFHAAGLDVPLFVYERVLGRRPPVPTPRRDGVRLLSPIDDLRSSVQLRREGELSVGAWARSLFHRQHFLVFTPSDPLPSAVSLSRSLGRGMLKSLAGRSLDGRAPTGAA